MDRRYCCGKRNVGFLHIHITQGSDFHLKAIVSSQSVLAAKFCEMIDQVLYKYTLKTKRTKFMIDILTAKLTL